MRPMHKPFQVKQRRAGLNATKLRLANARPSGNNFLRDYLPVKWMSPVGVDYLAHVAIGECVPHSIGKPKCRRNARNGEKSIARPILAGGTKNTPVITGKASSACAIANLVLSVHRPRPACPLPHPSRAH